MPNPKRKHSKARRDKRRGGQRKTRSVNLSTCSNCKKLRLPHRVCPYCGYYNGKPVIIIKTKENKKKR